MAYLDIVLYAVGLVLAVIAAWRTPVGGWHLGWLAIAVWFLTLLTP